MPRRASTDGTVDLTARLAAAEARAAALERELAEALQQQTAMAEVLRIISGSPTDPQPVFAALIDSAVRLLGARQGTLVRVEDDHLRAVAIDPGSPPDLLGRRLELRRDSMTARAILERRIVRIAGRLDDFEEEYAQVIPVMRAAGYERVAAVAVPLMRDGSPLGAIIVNRDDGVPFSDQQVALLVTFADQAVIAIENARLFQELNESNASLKEALEQQTATGQVLQAISRSPTDLQAVLDTIAESAVRLCNGVDAVIWRGSVEERRIEAHVGPLPSPLAAEELSPFGVDDAPAGRAMSTGLVVHFPDAVNDASLAPALRARMVAQGVASVLVAPLLRDRRAIGAITVRRAELRPFTEQQIALLQTFADQAVIAIENARLFAELQERNKDLTEALDQQTATADVLKVISRSAFDLQTVLDALTENAARLCGAEFGIVTRFDGDQFAVAATYGLAAEIRDRLEALTAGHPFRPGPGSVLGRMALERQTLQLVDVLADPGYQHPEVQQLLGHRTVVVVPMFREGALVGAFSIYRRHVEAFTERQIELLTTFADQAVIAVENTRLFRELQERLEEQTATSEILRAISESPAELLRVLDAIAATAARLCEADDVNIARLHGDRIRVATSLGELAQALARLVDDVSGGEGLPRQSITARAIEQRRVVHVPDTAAEPPDELRTSHLVLDRLGLHTVLAAPLLSRGQAVGAIVIYRRETRPFSDRHIALLRTFADQAVIAIENARLFAELQERTEELTRSVERLTALFEVSQAVSSTLDLGQVLEAVVGRAADLAGADGGAVYEYEPASQTFELRATYRMDPELIAAIRELRIRLGETVVGQAAAQRAPAQIADVLQEQSDSPTRRALERAGYRAVLSVPLLREQEIIGALVVRRRAAGAFPPDTVALLQTFASQSALAIQNARLFAELAEKSRQLEEASRHKSEFLANMSHELRTPLNAIIGFSDVLLEKYFGELTEKQEEYLKDVLTSGQHLLALINDILDLSKVEAGRMELELSTFALTPVLESGLVMVRERASKNGVALELQVDDGTGRIEADERKVKQVVFNLLSNAVKFTPSGGRVTLSARREGDWTVIAVADTGVGIAPEDRNRIFEEFGQARGRNRAEGTGLGLTLTKQFVELHGGTIGVESEVGRGSTFTVRLPVRQAVRA